MLEKLYTSSICSDERFKEQSEYWMKNLMKDFKDLKLPYKYEEDYINNKNYESIHIEITNCEYEQLLKLNKGSDMGIYITLLAIFNSFIFKYTGDNEILVGSPTLNEKQEFILNALIPVKNTVNSSNTFKDILIKTKNNVLEAYRNQDYPIEVVLKNIGLDKKRFFSSLNIIFSLENIHGLKFLNECKYDLAFLWKREEDKISCEIVYNTNAFANVDLNSMINYYIRTFDIVMKDLDISIKNIDLVTVHEKNRILYEFNDTDEEYARNKMIHELFEEQVERKPYNFAVLFENEKLTYKELNEKANSVAKILRKKGIKEDSIVGIMIERSLEMIIGIMAILKAGGAYLPIDPNYPKDRIEYILNDSGCKVLLSEEKSVENIEFDGEFIDLIKDDLFNEDLENLEKVKNSNSLAYVIYTSGTTGKPKGAMIEHKSLVNRLNWMQKKYPLSENDTILQKTTYTFDVSVWEILWWSLVGAKVCMLSPNDEKDAIKIVEAIDKYSVTTLHFVPSMLDVFLYSLEENSNASNLPSLRQVFCSGEALNFKQVSRFYEKFGNVKKLVNLYGPTEATIDVSYFDCIIDEHTKVIPIGKPIDNIKLYVLNNNELVPIGVPGELCISGEGLARGYLNRPKLTAEKFIDNPFEAGRKMYKTGDLVRWLSDGNIEFLGRIDNQVKIRGFRIELGEIENRLLQHESIKEAVVVVKENKDRGKYICAYVVSKKSLNELNLKGYLKEVLPEYMVPAYFMNLEKMPLTINGKLDRRALLEPKMDNSSNEYEAPRNEIEEKLVDIWKNILAVEVVGINDNFFDLGGHSLKATVLVSKIYKELNIQISIKEIFKRPTIKEISEYISSSENKVQLSIELIEEKDYYEASSAQKRMYMLQMFNLESIGYNMTCIMKVKGNLIKEKLEKSIERLIERHEVLRTSFEIIEGEIVQKISESVRLELYYTEALGIDTDKIIKEFIKPFDLSKAPLLRVGLIKITEDKHIFMVDMHHIISDGISMGILIKEFSELYNGYVLAPLKVQYKDFAAWQNNFLESEEMKKQEEYWIERFQDEIPVLNMPTDFKRSAIQKFEGDSINFVIQKDRTEEIRKIAKETGSTIYMVILSSLNILLSKYSGQEDIIIGSPIAGRTHADLENVMGMFVNTLAMRNHPQGEKSYDEFLKEVKENALKAYENQDYQFEQLIDKLNLKRDMSRNPLFDVMFVMQNMDIVNVEMEDLKFERYGDGTKIAKFDITLSAYDNVEDILLNFEYSTKLFKKETIQRLIEHFNNILDKVVANRNIKISKIEIIDEEERSKLIYEFNNTCVECSECKTIHQLFEEQVEKTPDNVAVIFKDKQLTYRQLNEKSNQLARVLRHKGVKQESIVGIMVERSFEMMIGIIGILKSGAAYLPIDPQYPEERIKYMLEDSKTTMVLTYRNLMNKLEFNGELIDIENDEIYLENRANLDNINELSSLAYIIYTSGSTGRPKGVMIEHGSISTTLHWRKNEYNMKENDRVIQLIPFAFDGFVTTFFTPLISGATAVLLRTEEIKDAMHIKNCIYENKITHFISVPSMYMALLEVTSKEEISSLKVVTLAGEKLNSRIIEKSEEINSNIEIVNEYGPTENSVITTIMKCVEVGDIIPIGKPKSNTQIYILDNEYLKPIGIVGEICIAGQGLARGYCNNEELTAEKFTENPITPKQRLYRTGDLGRWLSDGNIEFLGRIDHQVKIRGFRIELGEIERQLLNYEAIKEAVVIDREDVDGVKYLCAYVVTDIELTVRQIREYLSKNLPEYMIPSYFMQLDKIPLTSNGKVDRNLLLQIDEKIAVGIEYEQPKNEIEQCLVNIWKDVLHAKQIGTNDNFFELGGHSLKGIQIISMIEKEFGTKITLMELFEMPSINLISELIKSKKEHVSNKIILLPKQKFYELSYAQKRLWIINKLDPNSIAYNMPGRMTFFENVDINIIERVFNTLIRRHEAFRTRFKEIDGNPVQIIDEEINLQINTIDLSKLDEEKKSKQRELIYVEQSKKIFNLEISPLLYVRLVKLNEKEYEMVYSMHHIICDGWSMQILKNEFFLLYEIYKKEEKYQYSPLNIQYKDFAVWQNRMIEDKENMELAKSFWHSQLDNEIPVLELPISCQDRSFNNRNSSGYRITFTEDQKNKLRQLSQNCNTSLFVTMITTLNIFLFDLTGQDDILIGTATFGRNHPDLKNIIGYFVNTTILRNKVNNNETFTDLLKRINRNTLTALEYQSYPIELILDELKIKFPNISLFFNMLNIEENTEKVMEDFNFYHIDKVQEVKFDLMWYVTEYSNGIEIICNYISNLFDASTIEYMMKRYSQLIDSILEKPSVLLSEHKASTKGRKICKR